MAVNGRTVKLVLNRLTPAEIEEYLRGLEEKRAERVRTVRQLPVLGGAGKPANFHLYQSIMGSIPSPTWSSASSFTVEYPPASPGSLNEGDKLGIMDDRVGGNGERGWSPGGVDDIFQEGFSFMADQLTVGLLDTTVIDEIISVEWFRNAVEEVVDDMRKEEIDAGAPASPPTPDRFLSFMKNVRASKSSNAPSSPSPSSVTEPDQDVLVIDVGDDEKINLLC